MPEVQWPLCSSGHSLLFWPALPLGRDMTQKWDPPFSKMLKVEFHLKNIPFFFFFLSD